MATNLALDDALIDEAFKLGGQHTKKDVVTQALQEYVQRCKQLKLVELFELFDTVDFDETLDAKAQRSFKSALTAAP